jgi:hypothetical protein
MTILGKTVNETMATIGPGWCALAAGGRTGGRSDSAWVLHRIERLDFEFTFPIRSRNIETELPSKPLGAGNFTDTAKLIPLTTDFHFATLASAESGASVLRAVFSSSFTLCKQL